VLIRLVLSVLPILVFLFALQLIDTYKLLRLRSILQLVAAGSIIAAFCYAINSFVFGMAPAGGNNWAKFGSPILEEMGKGLVVVWLIRKSKVGFMVDAAIAGFAVGAGFALVENLFYLPAIAAEGVATAAVRGLGTALMHGGTTSIFSLLSVNRSEMTESRGPMVFLPGMAVAVLIHSLFNQAVLPPLTSAIVLSTVLPAIFAFVLWRGERALEKWMGSKLDKDMDLLHMIATGAFSASHAGKYLRSLEKSFGAVRIGDMLCYLQLSLELSAQAKGDLLRQEMGFPLEPDPELPARLRELSYLEKQLGRAGKRALTPLLGSSRRDIWELQQLADRAGTAGS
jgi:RsiW-degrading membrane proteinase PrsW (M82 family)